MLCLLVMGGTDRGLERAKLSLGMLGPDGYVWDFGRRALADGVRPGEILAAARGEPAAVTFAPSLGRAPGMQLAANKARVVALKRKPAPVPTDFQTGYDALARERAIFWRSHGVGAQPLLAAGVFALSTIQTPIVTALRLFALLGPYVLEDKLPPVQKLERIVQQSGAGLHSAETGRPRWYRDYATYRKRIVRSINDERLQDNELRERLAIDQPMPLGLGLAKLSFTLALVGHNLGCLDARILAWAYTERGRENVQRRLSRKNPDGTVSVGVYDEYRHAELDIFRKTPFYDPDDPVGIARSQWMLWESLGPESARTHTHEELFDAVVDDRLAQLEDA